MAANDVVSLLKSCIKHKDLCKGKKLYASILKQGLLKKNCHIAAAVVNMYAKCGAIAEAAVVLDGIPARDIISWSVLITGCIQCGKDEQAVRCFEQMQCEGLFPDAIIFTCVLKACGNMGALDKGEQTHQEIKNQGLHATDVMLDSALVDMYVQCGALGKAAQAFNELCVRNVVSWNTLISGYAQHGQGAEALEWFEQMQYEGHLPDCVTYTCILKACGSIGAADRGELIHQELIRQGLLKKDIILGTALVDMYAKSDALLKATEVFDELTVRDVTAWSVLITGYAEHGHGMKALRCLELMQWEGLCPNTIIYVCVLTAIGNMQVLDFGKQIHGELKIQGLLGRNLILGNALVSMYVTHGELIRAAKLLEELPVRDVISWSALIAGYIEEGHNEEALKCLEHMLCEGISPNTVTVILLLKACGHMGAIDKGKQLHNRFAEQCLLRKDIILGNALVDMYAKCGALEEAKHVFDRLALRDIVSWNAVIAGYIQLGQCEEALNCFEMMQYEGLFPNSIVCLYILKACGAIGAVEKGEQVYDEILQQGISRRDVMLGTALLDMYSKCGALTKAAFVFEKLHVRDIVSWSALITGYTQHGQGEQALKCLKLMELEGLSPGIVTFSCILKACGSIEASEKGEQIHGDILRLQLQGKEVVLDTTVVDMYAKCGALAKASRVHSELPLRDAISWNALIAGYVQQGLGEETMKCFVQMQNEGVSPSPITFICILKAYGSIGALNKGKQLHDEVSRLGLLGDTVLGNSLVAMYAKCGAIRKASQVLDELPLRSVATWNALMTGYVLEGQYGKALKSLERMHHEGLYPDAITWTCLLTACSRSGMLNEGQTYFATMSMKYGITPDVEHHTCMVDLLSHAGKFSSALAMIKQMPTSDHLSVWLALLGSCQQCGNVEVGRLAFDAAIQVDKMDSAAYVLMVKTCVAAGMLESAMKVEALREKQARNWMASCG